jgi:molecular chaperone DnaK
VSDVKPGVFGIDLGTTYSVIAYVDETGRASVVANQYGENTTPSVVYFETDTNVVVGTVAKESSVISPESVVSMVKRRMGNSDYSQTFFGKEYTAPAVSALILKALVTSVETAGHSVGKVVITVPAYFGMLEKEATRQAGEIAGLDVIGIVPEPVAAALAYGLGGQADGKTVVVYDLGGGTFDVTVMRIGATQIEVLAVGGDHNLGGANWDEALFEYLVSEVIAQSGDEAIRDDDQSMQDIWNLAERTKKELSSAETRNVIVRVAGKPTKVTITRAQLEQLTAHLVEQTISITQRTLAEAEALYPGVEKEISNVLLVGGSCKMPIISTTVNEAFRWKAELADPDLAVAKGAALYAAGKLVRDIVDRTMDGTFSSESRDGSDKPPVSLTDLTSEQEAEIVKEAGGLPLSVAVDLGSRTVINALPKAIGIKLVDTTVPNWEEADPMPHYVHHLVAAQTQVAFKPEEPFLAATVVANQDVIPIEIWEQAGAVAGRAVSQNRLLEAGHLKAMRSLSLPKGSPIEVYFDVDDEGLVRIRAVEPSSKREVQVEARIQLLSDVQVAEAKANVAGLVAAT